MSHRADRFPRVGRLHRGYHRHQVDAFVHRVEVSLSGVLPPVSAGEIRRTGFELVLGGYATAAVDAALDELEQRAMAAARATGGRRGRVDPESETTFLRGELTAPYMRRFPRAATLRRGYDLDSVDDFLDRVADTLAGHQHLTVDDVRGVSFPPQRGGYDEDAVDETLDRVVELMLFMQQPAQPPTGPGPTDHTDATGLLPPVH